MVDITEFTSQGTCLRISTGVAKSIRKERTATLGPSKVGARDRMFGKFKYPHFKRRQTRRRQSLEDKRFVVIDIPTGGRDLKIVSEASPE